MKRYLILILVAILVMASALLVYFNVLVDKDKPSLTEKQVIELLHDHLINKVDQLQGLEADLNKTTIGATFFSATLIADLETSKEFQKQLEEGQVPSLDSVEMQFWSSGHIDRSCSVWVETLKNLTNYDGDGWWHVSISDCEWMVNETTRQVTAQNEEARKQLEETTLKTYHNGTYGYSIDYRPNWAANDEQRNAVLIFSPDFKADITVWVLETSDFPDPFDLEEYVLAKFVWLMGKYHEFEITDSEEGYPVWRVDYTYNWFEGGQTWECKHYFIHHEDRVYEVVSSAVLLDPALAALPPYLSSDLFDGYKTFRFGP